MKIAWFSAGITSAVSTKLSLELYEDVEIYYIHIGSAHKDNERFIRECEKWYGQKINVITNSKGYEDQFDVIQKTRYINGPSGARCTLELKKNVRYELQDKLKPENQIFGFEYSKGEINRAIRLKEQHPDTNPLFPLIEKKLTKEECHGLMHIAGIKAPEMYKLGYNNNNCIGCVKGKKGYWNKIRQDFPEHFDKMAELEREIGNACIKEDLPKDKWIQREDGTFKKSKPIFLDELNPTEGILNPIVPDCGMFCQLEFTQFMDKRVDAIYEGRELL
jgi:3'-phosphoadenosine 5'-phosphosulfate sulfotransferase (PAPS reductase)/FAD synthetase